MSTGENVHSWEGTVSTFIKQSHSVLRSVIHSLKHVSVPRSCQAFSCRMEGPKLWLWSLLFQSDTEWGKVLVFAWSQTCISNQDTSRRCPVLRRHLAGRRWQGIVLRGHRRCQCLSGSWALQEALQTLEKVSWAGVSSGACIAPDEVGVERETDRPGQPVKSFLGQYWGFKKGKKSLLAIGDKVF